MEGQDDCRAGNYAPGLLFHLDNGEVGTEPYPNVGTARGPIIPVRGRACCRLQDFVSCKALSSPSILAAAR